MNQNTNIRGIHGLTKQVFRHRGQQDFVERGYECPPRKLTVKTRQVSSTELDPQVKDRESLIREFVPIIKVIALRLAVRMPSGLNVEDLISVGTLGLLDAVGKFDPTRNIKFRTYAEFRIRGAMLDEIRAMDWVPRSVRMRIGKIQDAANKFTSQHGRPPTEGELARALEMEANKINEILLQAKGTVLLSLEDMRTQDEETQSVLDGLVDRNQPNPLEALLSEDRRKILAEALGRLSERQRLVLNLYHYEELTMKEIGAVLNVTESRVCQLHAQAMIRLKALLRSRLSRT